MKKIREEVEDENFIVLYHNCGNNVELLVNNIAKIDAAAYGFGNAIDIETTLKALPEDRMIIGNIDPAGTIRNGNPEMIRREVLALMERCCRYPNFVIASGCDIPPMTPLENLQAFFDAAAEFYNK